jgi:hypothetical protein
MGLWKNFHKSRREPKKYPARRDNKKTINPLVGVHHGNHGYCKIRIGRRNGDRR